MQCSELQDLLNLYLDGLLLPEQSNIVEQHLAECTGCHQEMEALCYTIHAMASLEQLDPPPEFKQNVRKSLEDNLHKRTFWNRIIQIIPASRLATVACFLLIIVVTVQSLGKIKSTQEMKLATNSLENQSMISKDMGQPTKNDSIEKTEQFIMEAEQGVDQILFDEKNSSNDKQDSEIQRAKKSINLTDNSSLQNNSFGSADRDGLARSIELTSEMLAGSAYVLDKKIINKANLSLETTSIDQSEEKLAKILKDNSNNNWSIQNSSLTRERQEISRGGFIIRIPQKQFYLAVDSLETLGVLKNKEISAEDVTEKYVQLKTAITNIEAEEEKFLELLNETKSVEQLKIIRDELTLIRERKQIFNQELNQLNDYLEYSAIEVNLLETVPPVEEIKVNGWKYNGFWSWGPLAKTANWTGNYLYLPSYVQLLVLG